MAAEQAGPPQSNYEKLIEILVWPLAVIIIVIIIAYLARDKIPGLFDRLIELSYKGGIAKFAERADDALTTAAREALKRPSDRIDDFTNEDYELAIDLVRRAGKRDLPKIKQLVWEQAENYRRIRSWPRNNQRSAASAAVFAKMRILGFVAKPLLRDLMSNSHHVGERLAAVGILQVESCYDPEVLNWLATRMSKLEGPFVQYHALRALLFAARRASSIDKPQVREALQKAQSGYDEAVREGKRVTKQGTNLLKEISDELQFVPG